jgi:hypothetical protein
LSSANALLGKGRSGSILLTSGASVAESGDILVKTGKSQSSAAGSMSFVTGSSNFQASGLYESFSLFQWKIINYLIYP